MLFKCLLQAYVELTTLEDVLKPYVNRQSERNFEMSREYLADWDVQSPDKYAVQCYM